MILLVSLEVLTIVIAKLKNLMPLLNQLGTPGVVYNLYGSDSRAYQVSSLTQGIITEINYLRDYYESYVYFLLIAQKRDNCSAVINQNYETLMNSMETLYQYFKYYTIGNPRVLRQAFVDSCANNTCLNALSALLDSITGDFEDQPENCDLLTSLYDGFPARGFYQGHRDYVINIATFALNLGVIGVTLQSGSQIIATGDQNQWRLQQTQFLLKVKGAYDRIMEFDRMLLNPDSISWNAQRNLRQYLSEQIEDDFTYLNVSTAVQKLFNDLYPSRYWLVYAYQNVQGQSLNSWQCVYCFSAQNIKGKYNVMIASIDKNAVPNTDLIFSSAFDSINNYKNQANILVKDWYYSQCLMGVFATSGDVVGSFSGIADFKGIRLMQSETKVKTTVAIWAVQGVCPGQSQ